jgi:hypothetical protein
MRAVEVRVPQIDRTQVESIPLSLRSQREAATAKHCQAGLQIRGPDLQLWHLIDWCGDDVMAGHSRWPQGMAADERSKDLAHHGAVGGRVTGDPLQRVDPTKPHVKLGVAELVDRAGGPLGDLPLLGDLEWLAAVGKLFTTLHHLAVGEVRAP